MVLISEPRDSITGVPSIWAADTTCKSADNGSCKVTSTKKSRRYIVRITATDKAGLIDWTECETIVGEQDYDDTEPVFLLKKVSYKGGFELVEGAVEEGGIFA